MGEQKQRASRQRPGGVTAGPSRADLPASSTGESRRPHWRRLLAGSSPREVLARLINGDPLGLRALVSRRLRVRCYLMDADRVFLRSIARCARFSSRYRGQPTLDQWLEDRVDEALGDLLCEDLEAERTGSRSGAGSGGAHEDLARPLGLDPAQMRRACVAFNHAEFSQRKAFFDLVIAGRSLDELARSSGSGATEIARRARRALDLCLAEATPEDRAEEQHA